MTTTPDPLEANHAIWQRWWDAYHNPDNYHPDQEWYEDAAGRWWPGVAP